MKDEKLRWQSHLQRPLDRDLTHRLVLNSTEAPHAVFSFFLKRLKREASLYSPLQAKSFWAPEPLNTEQLLTKILEEFNRSRLLRSTHVSECVPIASPRTVIEIAWQRQSAVEFSYSSERLQASGRATAPRESLYYHSRIYSIHAWGFRLREGFAVRSYSWENLREARLGFGWHLTGPESVISLHFLKGASSREPGYAELVLTKTMGMDPHFAFTKMSEA